MSEEMEGSGSGEAGEQGQDETDGAADAAGYAERFRGQRALSLVETDLFCHGCGYNTHLD